MPNPSQTAIETRHHSLIYWVLRCLSTNFTALIVTALLKPWCVSVTTKMRPARLAMATIYAVSFRSSLQAAIILRALAPRLPRRHHAAVAAAAAGADAIEPALAG
jgi:hypothetical protein